MSLFKSNAWKYRHEGNCCLILPLSELIISSDKGIFVSMNQSREIKSFIFSQYFSDGLRITFGVLLPSLVFYNLGHLSVGLTISLGALCVSIADNPGPVVHKRNGMLFCVLFVFLTALITSLLNWNPVFVGL